MTNIYLFLYIGHSAKLCFLNLKKINDSSKNIICSLFSFSQRTTCQFFANAMETSRKMNTLIFSCLHLERDVTVQQEISCSAIKCLLLRFLISLLSLPNWCSLSGSIECHHTWLALSKRKKVSADEKWIVQLKICDVI